MICSKCNEAHHEPTAIFCHACGMSLFAEMDNRCPKCGIDVVSGARFCHNCGTQLINHSDNDIPGTQHLDPHLVIDRDGYVSCNGPLQEERLVIPSKIKGVVVKGVHNFKDQSELKEVVLPDTVTILGPCFDHCFSLEKINIPNGVTTIDDGAFAHCVSLKKIEIPKSVTQIGRSAFYNCTALESVAMSNYVHSIGIQSFAKCHSLRSVQLPKSLREIGDAAFEGCKSLNTMTIPLFVQEIGSGAFSECESLKMVIIEGPTRINDYAFSFCNNLERIVIRDCHASKGSFAASKGIDKNTRFANCHTEIVMDC
jgi:hypothetical protein